MLQLSSQNALVGIDAMILGERELKAHAHRVLLLPERCSELNDTAYTFASGTSMAVPHAAGLAAIYLAGTVCHSFATCTSLPKVKRVPCSQTPLNIVFHAIIWQVSLAPDGLQGTLGPHRQKCTLPSSMRPPLAGSMAPCFGVPPTRCSIPVFRPRRQGLLSAP